MTLYVCNQPHHTVILGKGKSQIVEDEIGNKQLKEVVAGLEVRFEGSALTSRAVDVATQLWFNGVDGAPAMYPNSSNGLFRHIIMNDDGTASWGGEEFYSGVRKERYLSAYDSAWPGHYIPFTRRINGEDYTLTPAEFTQMVDERLMSHANYGIDFIRVDAVKLPAPWPGYDEIKGVEGAKRIKEIILATGIDAGAVVAYENQRGEQARPSYVKAAEDARNELAAQRAEQAALEVAP